MDAQDFCSLQEAYMEVVENQQLDEVLDTPQETQSYAAKNAASAVGAFVRGDKETLSKRFKGAERGMKKIEKRKEQNEQVDLYDIILSHLLDEGYAETPEAAEVIMVNMSEEWREFIFEREQDEGRQPSMSQLDKEEDARRRSSGSAPETLEQRIKRRAAEQRARGYGGGRRRY
jgi:hypothetical protein